jgi:hypothetical protein
MDLLHAQDGRWHIVDYKTNALKGRTPEEAARSYEPQAVVYCLAAFRSGARSVRMDFVFLEQPASPVTFEYFLDAVAGLEETLDQALLHLRRQRYSPEVGDQCDTCSVQEVCTNMAPGSADGIQ